VGEWALSFKSKLLSTLSSIGVMNDYNSFNELHYSELILGEGEHSATANFYVTLLLGEVSWVDGTQRIPPKLTDLRSDILKVCGISHAPLLSSHSLQKNTWLPTLSPLSC
jgi:hypothetical protein